jgi:hypothetical protein
MQNQKTLSLNNPSLQTAFKTIGKWSRLIAIIIGALFMLAIIIALVVMVFVPSAFSIFLAGIAVLPFTSTHLYLLIFGTTALSLFATYQLYLFGNKIHKAAKIGFISSTTIMDAFSHLILLLKVYVIYSVVNLIINALLIFV